MLLELDTAGQRQTLDWSGFNRLPAEEELLEDAVGLVAGAEILIAHFDVALLSLTCERRKGLLSVSVRPWRPGPAIGPAIEPLFTAAPHVQSALSLMHRHGQSLCSTLAGRWPGSALPAAIGLVTDGQGVAISQDHPSATDTRWLTEHVSGEAPASAIIPFDAVSAWLRLSGSERRQDH